jgi:hypothetical protein
MTEEYKNEDMLGGDEFVFTRDGNGIFVGGGYKIDSFLLNQGMSPMTTLNGSEQSGGKVSSPFENLAVPAGLFYVNMRVPKKQNKKSLEEHYKAHETISDDIMDKLYSFIEVDKKHKRKTRKHSIKPDKTKTRRH